MCSAKQFKRVTFALEMIHLSNHSLYSACGSGINLRRGVDYFYKDK
jgi:hypothetical protein